MGVDDLYRSEDCWGDRDEKPGLVAFLLWETELARVVR